MIQEMKGTEFFEKISVPFFSFIESVAYLCLGVVLCVESVEHICITGA
jgi:hypothetical protein